MSREWKKLCPEEVKTIEAPEAMAVKIHQGQRSWPPWMEVTCMLAMGEMEVP